MKIKVLEKELTKIISISKDFDLYGCCIKPQIMQQ
jgi:hypothetical protein